MDMSVQQEKDMAEGTDEEHIEEEDRGLIHEQCACIRLNISVLYQLL